MSDLFEDSNLDVETPQDVIIDPEDIPFVKVPKPMLEKYGRELGPLGITAYIGLRSFANRKRGMSAFPAIKSIADLTGMGESTVRRELVKLEQMGFISRTQRTGRSTIYVITPPRYDIADSPLLCSGHPATIDTRNKKNLIRSNLTTVLTGDTDEPPKKKRRTREQIFSPFTEETKEVVNAVLDLWPKTRPGNKSKITPDVPLLASRVDELLSNPSLTSSLLLGAATRYVAEAKEWPHAPEFFFGPGKNGDGPPWRPYAKMEYHEQHKQLTLAVAAGATQ